MILQVFKSIGCILSINSDRKGGELTYKESIKMMKEWRKDEE